MNILRTSFDKFYDLIKPAVFYLTSKDPEVAHELFISGCKTLHALKLEKLVLDNSTNKLFPDFEISNAAGLNKNAEIPPQVLRYFGFDRTVVGTVTYDRWKGNPRPRCIRYPKTESLVNWMGLPGVGAKEVADNLNKYGDHGVNITVSVMATPGKQGDDALRDIESTVLEFRSLPYVDRIKLNPSCPNTHATSGTLDARKENEKWQGDMLSVVKKAAYPFQKIEEKVSPDLNEDDVDYYIDVSKGIVDGFVISNTTRIHDIRYIPNSPGKGGASGNAAYELAFNVQKLFDEKRRARSLKFYITACGGINSIERLRERLSNGATGVEVYTGFIFKGPKLLREFRDYNH